MACHQEEPDEQHANDEDEWQQKAEPGDDDAPEKSPIAELVLSDANSETDQDADRDVCCDHA